jgi:hypothetical protein
VEHGVADRGRDAHHAELADRLAAEGVAWRSGMPTLMVTWMSGTSAFTATA